MGGPPSTVDGGAPGTSMLVSPNAELAITKKNTTNNRCTKVGACTDKSPDVNYGKRGIRSGFTYPPGICGALIDNSGNYLITRLESDRPHISLRGLRKRRDSPNPL